jgi:hypothetical protein
MKQAPAVTSIQKNKERSHEMLNQASNYPGRVERADVV